MRTSLHLAFLLATTTLALACRNGGVPTVEKAEDTSAQSSPDPFWRSPAGVTTTTAALGSAKLAQQGGGCDTLTSTTEEPDVLRASPLVNGRVLYANAQVGLAIIDASEPDDPKLVATSAFVGAPLGVFERDNVAAVVYAPWDREPAETVVRSVDLQKERAGQTISEWVMLGAGRDARRVGDAIVVTRELPRVAESYPVTTAVTTFVSGENGLEKRDELRFVGRGPIVGASPHGIAVAREALPELGPDRTSVTWIGLSPSEPGVEHLHGTITFSGVVPRWRRSSDHVVDVTEDARVRVVACASAGCPQGSAATYAALDFSEPDRPRLTSWSMIARAGDGVFNFDGGRVFVARPPAEQLASSSSSSSREQKTEIAVFRTTNTAGDLEPAGAVLVRGNVSSIALRPTIGRDTSSVTGDIVALGWTGSASAGKRAVIHQIDARRSPPRAIGSLAFGGDWTWSPAYDDDRAFSFDPASSFAAIPMTTLRDPKDATLAVQVFGFGPRGPTSVMEREVDMADRLLFVDGRLLAFSADGVVVVRQPGERPYRTRTWDDLRSLIR